MIELKCEAISVDPSLVSFLRPPSCGSFQFFSPIDNIPFLEAVCRRIFQLLAVISGSSSTLPVVLVFVIFTDLCPRPLGYLLFSHTSTFFFYLLTLFVFFFFIIFSSFFSTLDGKGVEVLLWGKMHIHSLYFTLIIQEELTIQFLSLSLSICVSTCDYVLLCGYMWFCVWVRVLFTTAEGPEKDKDKR